MSHTGARPDFWDKMIGSGDPQVGSFDYWDCSDPSYECDEVTPETLDSPEGFSPQIPLQSSQSEAETSALDIQHPDIEVPETIHPSCLSNASDSPLNRDSHRPSPPCLALYPACDSLSHRADTLLHVDSELSCPEHSEYSREQAIDSVFPDSANGSFESPFPRTTVPLIVSPSSLPPTLLHSSAQAGLRVVRVYSCFDPPPFSSSPTRAPPPSCPPHAAELQCAYPRLSQVVDDIAQVKARMARTLRAVELALSRSGFPARSSVPPSDHGTGSGSQSRAYTSSQSACITPCCSSALVDDEPRSPPRCSRDDGSARDREDAQPSSADTFTPVSSSWIFKLELDSEMGGGIERALFMIGQQLALRVHPTSTSTLHRPRVSSNPPARTPVCAGSRTQTHPRCGRHRSRSRCPSSRRSPCAGEQ